MEISRIRVGEMAPEFQSEAVMPNGAFGEVKLADYRGKYVLLLFYPLDFTFVCPTELKAFSERYAEFSERNTEVLGISVDSKFSHLAWMNTPPDQGGLGALKYPLVSDITRQIANQYDVLLPNEGVALRGLFIIDPDGRLQYSSVSALNVGRNVDEAVRVLAALQYTRENPDEVCPINWTAGQSTIKPESEVSAARSRLSGGK